MTEQKQKQQQNPKVAEHPYADILHLSRPWSLRHPVGLPLSSRAAQFAPFAALTGHSEAVVETARLTENYVELSAEQKEELNQSLMQVEDLLEEKGYCKVEITFFQQDLRKEGGSWAKVTGEVKRVEGENQRIRFRNGQDVAFPMIRELIILD